MTAETENQTTNETDYSITPVAPMPPNEAENNPITPSNPVEGLVELTAQDA